ncbi:MAG: transposase [Bacteroidales bacterium]|nr:transposase [Bacteroidales bacterium]
MNIRNRKTPRAKWHDYNGAEYFVTICTKNREHYFGEIHDGQMQLTVVGEWLKMQIENTETIRGGDVSIPLYVIMPNHVHLIVYIRDSICRDALNASVRNTLNASVNNALNASVNNQTNNNEDARSASLQRFGPQSKNLGSIIRGIKSSVTKFARQNGIPFMWQSRYHDHIIRNQDEKNKIGIYIEQNPLRWEYDCFYKND